MRRLFLLAFIWGWSFLFIKVAVRGMTPSTVAAIRVALGAGVLFGYVRARGWKMPAGWAWWRHFVFVGLVGSAVPFTLLAWGEQYVSSALTAVLNASTPLFAAVCAWLLLDDRLTPLHAAGLLLGFFGVGVTAGVGGEDLASSSLLAEGASVAAAACYGLSFAYSRRNLMGLPPVVAAAGQLTTAAALVAPVALVTSVRQGFEVGWRSGAAVVLLGLFGSGAAYVLSYRLIADVGPTRASVVTYLIPVVAVAVGVVFLNEPFSFRLVAGGLLIVAGIFVLGFGNRKPVAAVQPS